MLSDGLKTRLESRFNAPVLDIYSLNRPDLSACSMRIWAGICCCNPGCMWKYSTAREQPVAPGDAGNHAHRRLQFLPAAAALPYRDHAAITYAPEGLLTGLGRRTPVRFRTQTGEWINNIDITHALRLLPAGPVRSASGRRRHTLSVPGSGVATPGNSLHPGAARHFRHPADCGEAHQNRDKILQYSSDLGKVAPCNDALESPPISIMLFQSASGLLPSVHTWWTGILGCILFGMLFFRPNSTLMWCCRFSLSAPAVLAGGSGFTATGARRNRSAAPATPASRKSLLWGCWWPRSTACCCTTLPTYALSGFRHPGVQRVAAMAADAAPPQKAGFSGGWSTVLPCRSFAAAGYT